MAVVYHFFQGEAEGLSLGKEVLGGKGFGLVEMASLEIPVPPGLIIPTDMCRKYMTSTEDEKTLLLDALTEKVSGWHLKMGAHFGYKPLLSVRSGAPVSMPGAKDTILNVGLTKENLPEWRARLGDWAALDCYRRLQQMYGETVTGIPHDWFQATIELVLSRKFDLECPPKTIQEASITHLEKLTERQGAMVALPVDENGQIRRSIAAVFESWNNKRAKEYRAVNGIPEDMGTAVVVQCMVFGNMNEQSCSGVLFSRNPSTGEDSITGEFLANAQGEDVVSGTRTPRPLSELSEWNPAIREQLFQTAKRMENHRHDMQDMEFTVQDGELFLLQTRDGKRSARAAVKIAVDLAKEGKITQEEAVSRITPEMIHALGRPTMDPTFKGKPFLTGIAAGGGFATGVIELDAEQVQARAASGKPVIFVAEETDPDDFSAMHAATGILTKTGGSTCHAACLARGMNKPCMVGATDLEIHGISSVSVGNVDLKAGKTVITICGDTGEAWLGEVPMLAPESFPELQTLSEWALAGKDVFHTLDFQPGMTLDSGNYLLRVTHTKDVQESLLLANEAPGSILIGLDTPEFNLTKEERGFIEMFSGTKVLKAKTAWTRMMKWRIDHNNPVDVLVLPEGFPDYRTSNLEGAMIGTHEQLLQEALAANRGAVNCSSDAKSVGP